MHIHPIVLERELLKANREIERLKAYIRQLEKIREKPELKLVGR